MSANDLKGNPVWVSIFNNPSQGSELNEGQLGESQSKVKIEVPGQDSGQGSNSAGVPAEEDEEPGENKEPEEDEEPEKEVWYRLKKPLTDSSCSTGNASDGNAASKAQDRAERMRLRNSVLTKWSPRWQLIHVFAQPALPTQSETSSTKQATYTTMPTTYFNRPSHPCAKPPVKQAPGPTKQSFIDQAKPAFHDYVTTATWRDSPDQPIPADCKGRLSFSDYGNKDGDKGNQNSAKRSLSFSDNNDQDGDMGEQNPAKRVKRGRSPASKPATAAMADIHGYRNVGILPWPFQSE